MSEEEKKPAEPGTAQGAQAAPRNDEKPDPGIQPPTYQFLTEGYDPDQVDTSKKDRKG